MSFKHLLSIFMSLYTNLTKLYLNLRSLMNSFLLLRLNFVLTVYI